MIAKLPVYTKETLIEWADKIDSRLGPIPGSDADALARLLRATAARMRQLQTDRDDQDRALRDAIMETAWTADASLIQLGPRYGYTGFTPITTRFAPLTLVNLWATYTAPLLKRLELGFGVSNLLGSANPFIQGYGDPAQGGNPPLPGPGRVLSLRVSYNF